MISRKGYLAELLKRIKLEKKQLNYIVGKRKIEKIQRDRVSMFEPQLTRIGLYSLVSNELQKITDPITASVILQQLDEKKLRYVADKFPLIEKYMKENYSQGVNEKDFMKYINERI
jgi:hypothetical protein